jgi:hypothetical protein
MTRSATQNKALHGLLMKLNIAAEHKAELVLSFTDGRTERSSEMTYAECQSFIQWCQSQTARGGRQVPADAQKKYWLSATSWVGISATPRGQLYMHLGRPVLDFVRIDAFCVERGNAHKPLQHHTSGELTTLVTIFERVLKADLK